MDRFELPQTGRAEVRMHSFARVGEMEKNGFVLRGERENLMVAYACDAPAATATAVACPTKPERGASVLRWCTLERTHRQITMATLLVPGDAPASLELSAGHDSAIQLLASAAGWKSKVFLTTHLEPGILSV